MSPPSDDSVLSLGTVPSSAANLRASNNSAVTSATPVSYNPTTVVDAQIHEKLLRDYKRLKARVDTLEKENDSLRTSLWEVSWKPRKGDRARAVIGIPSTTTTTTTTSAKEGEASVNGAAGEGTKAKAQGTITPASDSSQTDSALPTPTLPLPTSAFPSLTSTPSPSHPSSQSSSRSYTTTATTTVPPPTSSHSSRPTHSHSHPPEEKEQGTWRFQPSFTLKGHRGAVYALKFSESGLGGSSTSPGASAGVRRRTGGRVLASAGFDGVRLWGLKRDEGEDGGGDDEVEEGSGDKKRGELVGGGGKNLGKAGEGGKDEDDETANEIEEEDAWDSGDVDEIAHFTPHTAPVSSIAFSPRSTHLLTGGYDSTLLIFPLTTTMSTSPTGSRDSIWTLPTEGLVQSVCWIEMDGEYGGGGAGNLFAWGTSGKMLGVGDKRVGGKAVMEWRGGEMINSVQSFRHSPHIMTGDSSGQIRHFSLRTASFLPTPAETAASLANVTTAVKSKGTPISCLVANPDWNGRANGTKKEPRWVASTGFDNSIRIYDRGTDPFKSTPRLVQTLKGKNRNWPIKASWFQGKDYVDSPSPTTSKRRTAAASRTRSRSASFSSDRPFDDSDSDSSPNANESSSKPLPLSSSLLLATGSSDPVVLLYDLTKAPPTGIGAASTDGGVVPVRLEGHKDSVYAVDFLMNNSGGSGAAEEEGYRGRGILASAGADYTVRVWKPVWREAE